MRRRMLLKQSRLPSGYTEVEYISATTTQWINCDFASSNPKAEIKMGNLTHSSGAAFMWGQYSPHFATILRDASNIGYRVGSMSTVTVISDYDATQQLVFEMDLSSLIINGVTKATYSTSLNLTQFGLFGGMDSTTTVYNRSRLAGANLYYCKLWDGDTLARNFVPCINANNEVGLYDLVSDTFFSNSGTGVFTAGSPV